MKKIIAFTSIVLFLMSCGSTSTITKKQKEVENLDQLKFGIEVENLTEYNMKQSGLSHGVVITNVYSFHPANKAGILKGDIILNLDKHNILTLENFNKILKSYKYTYGQVTLGIFRNNQIKKIKVYLE